MYNFNETDLKDGFVSFMCIAAKKARKSGKPLKRQVSSPSFQRKEKSAEKASATNSLVLDFDLFIFKQNNFYLGKHFL